MHACSHTPHSSRPSSCFFLKTLACRGEKKGSASASHPRIAVTDTLQGQPHKPQRVRIVVDTVGAWARNAGHHRLWYKSGPKPDPTYCDHPHVGLVDGALHLLRAVRFDLLAVRFVHLLYRAQQNLLPPLTHTRTTHVSATGDDTPPQALTAPHKIPEDQHPPLWPRRWPLVQGGRLGADQGRWGWRPGPCSARIGT